MTTALPMLGPRDQFTAILRTPDEISVLEPDFGTRLRGVSVSTALNAGFHEASARYVRNGTDRVEIGHALDIMRRWRFGVVRMYLTGQLLWCGRIWEIRLGDFRREDQRNGSCTVEFAMSGFYRDLTMLLSQLDEGYSDDDAKLSPLQLAKELIGNTRTWWRIEEDFTQCVETGGNIAPINSSTSDYPLDLLVNAFQVGAPDGSESYFAIFDPNDGLVARPRGADTPRWRLTLWDTTFSIVWNGEEYSSDTRVIYTDEDNQQQTLIGWTSSYAEELHGKVQRQVMLTIDGTTQEAASQAAQTHLSRHLDPVGIDGELSLSGTIERTTGEQRPVWEIRCGDVVTIEDFAAGDPYFTDTGRLRRFAVETTKYDVDTGLLSLSLDTRDIRARAYSKIAEIKRFARRVQPHLNRGTNKHDTQTTSVAFSSYTSAANKDLMDKATSGATTQFNEFQWHQAKKDQVAIEVQFDAVSTNGAAGTCYFGYTLDGEDWTYTDSDISIRAYFSGNSNEYEKYQGLFHRKIKPGDHKIHVWARWLAQGAGATLTFANMRVTVR